MSTSDCIKNFKGNWIIQFSLIGIQRRTEFRVRSEEISPLFLKGYQGLKVVRDHASGQGFGLQKEFSLAHTTALAPTDKHDIAIIAG